MIYTVECSFADLDSEAEWNDFYSLEKLPALISVTGFHTSQRFKAITGGCPVYLAIHTIDGLDVLTGDEYRRKGGGNFAKWQRHITDWHRNLYSDIGFAPAVSDGEHLALSAGGPDSLIRLGLQPLAMQAVALEVSGTPLARRRATEQRAACRGASGRHSLYAPLTEQLTSTRALSIAQE